MATLNGQKIKLADRVELISTGATKKGLPAGAKFFKHPVMAKALVEEGKAKYANPNDPLILDTDEPKKNEPKKK